VSNPAAPPGKRPCRVLLVDDHPVMRMGLRQILETQPDLEVCGEAAGVADGLEKITELEPDVAIVDISLPDGSGLELIKQVKDRNSRVQLLVSSMHDERLYAQRALRAGAMGYVSKEEKSEVLIQAVNYVAKGRVYLSPAMTQRMLQTMGWGGDKPKPTGVQALSDRELEVFELIGRGLTTREIAERLQRSIKTVDSYRENIKAKLGLESGTELTRHAVVWILEGE
jgi:DNA-binding NarL/FixJ family response regulator